MHALFSLLSNWYCVSAAISAYEDIYCNKQNTQVQLNNTFIIQYT